jgi:pyrroline-5-carboxylate reductase
VAGFKVAVVGVGGMGALLATRIPGAHRKVIIGQERAEAAALADEVGGVASDQVSAVRGCQVVFLDVPGPAVISTVRDAASHLAEGAVVVNMVPEIGTADLAAEFPDIQFAAAKVIGHVREMAAGSPGVVVLDHVDEDQEERLRPLLDGLGTVFTAGEAVVPEAVAAVSRAMVRAQEALQADLIGLGLDRAQARTAIAATAPGILRDMAAVAGGNEGPKAMTKPETGAEAGRQPAH